jgi:hypothetical protein
LLPPERVIVPSSVAVSPVPAVGLPLASSGGHAVAHAPEQALFIAESALNRYRARPVELTRIDPRLLLATPTVADTPLEVVGVAPVATPPLPPQAATARATSGITAALARKVMGLFARYVAPLVAERRPSQRSAGVRITHRVVRSPKTS